MSPRSARRWVTPWPSRPSGAWVTGSTRRDGAAEMTAARRSLRQRLTLALVGLSVGSVALAGLITVVAARPAARSSSIAELRQGLDVIAEADRDGERPALILARLKNQLR